MELDDRLVVATEMEVVGAGNPTRVYDSIADVAAELAGVSEHLLEGWIAEDVRRTELRHERERQQIKAVATASFGRFGGEARPR